MIGTFYAAPGPGEAPFVAIGDEVEVGQVIGIVEAMKIMNEIIADRAGVVTELLVDNAQAVEYGSPLLVLGEQSDSIG
jgi:acetyl-CoA carboxylase biotin carboxyl carrier protein